MHILVDYIFKVQLFFLLSFSTTPLTYALVGDQKRKKEIAYVIHIWIPYAAFKDKLTTHKG